MPIDAVSSTNNNISSRNPNYEKDARIGQAVLSTAMGGVIGGIIGAVTAPPKVNSLSGFLTCKPDIFDKTMKNIENKADASSLAIKMTISEGRMGADTIEEAMHIIFPQDEITKKDYSDFINNKKALNLQEKNGFKGLLNDLEGMKGQDFSQKLYYDLLEKNKVLKDELFNLKLTEAKSALGDTFDKPVNKITDEMISQMTEFINKSTTSSENLVKKLEKALELEKNGVIKKADLMPIIKKSSIEASGEMLDNLGKTAFNSFKKFIPKNRFKSTMITGAGAAIIAGLTTYIFQPGQKKFESKMKEAQKG